MINQTTKNNSPIQTKNTPDKKPGSARFGNRPMSGRQSPPRTISIKSPRVTREKSPKTNAEQSLTKKESIKKIVIEKKEILPKVDLITVDPIVAAKISVE